MRKLRLKDRMRIVRKCVPIRLCHGMVLSGRLNLESGRHGAGIISVELKLCRKAEKNGKKKPTPSIESVGELNIL
jgi:hypothetical protein